MSFQLADVFILISPATVAVSMLAGATLSTVLRTVGVSGQAPWLLLTVLLTIGWSFFAMLGAARFAQGAETWEAYIGVCILWAVYSVSVSLVLKWRRRE